MPNNDSNSTIHIPCRKSMRKRFFDETVLFKPPAGTAVESRHLIRAVLTLKAVPQQISEQMVVAVPSALLIEQHQEQVGLRDPFNDLLALGGGRSQSMPHTVARRSDPG